MDIPAFPFAPLSPVAPVTAPVAAAAPAVAEAPTPAVAETAPVGVAPASAPAATAPAEVTKVAAPDRATLARIVSDKPRTRSVVLDWPILFEGKLYETVPVRRLDAKEVSDFVASLKNDPEAEERRWPMCDVPDAVLDALDDDDALAVDKAVADFLPRRFRVDATATVVPSA